MSRFLYRLSGFGVVYKLFIHDKTCNVFFIIIFIISEHTCGHNINNVGIWRVAERYNNNSKIYILMVWLFVKTLEVFMNFERKD